MAQTKLYKLNLLLTIIAVIIFVSCGNGIDVLALNSECFDTIEEELKSKFGENTYYTDLSITNDEYIGNIVAVTFSEMSESLKMEQWNVLQDTWKQNPGISHQVPFRRKATGLMFQLNSEINLSKSGRLVEASSKELVAQKNIENRALHLTFVKFPKIETSLKAKIL